jgi:predicted alpha/beta-hydrolase family hydrolase
MEEIAQRLHQRNIATIRFFFPYTQAGKKRPDRAPLLKQTIAAAIDFARHSFPDLPVFAGGKSMGGRMSSGLLSETKTHARGLIFLGFPLHPPGKESTARADHLRDVDVPMLFLQGTRDRLANLELMKDVVDSLAENATMHVVEGADHGFHVLKRSGRTDGEVMEELESTIGEWISKQLA